MCLQDSSEACLGSCQISIMRFFAKIVNDSQKIETHSKSTIETVGKGEKYVQS